MFTTKIKNIFIFETLKIVNKFVHFDNMDAEVARLSVAVGAALVVYLLALLRLRGIQRSDKRAGRTHRGPLTSVRANHGAFSRLVPRLIHDNQGWLGEGNR